MRYKSFDIKNFKGIQETTVDLTSMTGANVFAFVGLNESGKTTLLEAIHSFAPDYLSKSLIKGPVGDAKEIAQARVPRHKLANFSGDVCVAALLEFEAGDEQRIRDFAEKEYDLTIGDDEFPSEIRMGRLHRFERGDFVGDFTTLDFQPSVKERGKRKFKAPDEGERTKLWKTLYEFSPSIAFYPTFIFDFPKRIYLTLRPGAYDSFYRSVFQDVLNYHGQGYKIDDIVRRVQADEFKIPWPSFFSLFTTTESKGKVQQIIDRASQSMTEVVLGKWNEIFGEDASGKEVVVDFGLEEGRRYNRDSQSYESVDNHDIYVWFEIKDGSRRFKVNDRSLGFRWFFAFLLFTQFRASGNSRRPILFLFDEPASNLHAAAQQKLIESFPEIACGRNMLVYSTHSHYMIDPAWLEQTFIITNRSDAPSAGVLKSALLDDESLDIKATRYRQFSNENPSETSYFQPIIDRLDVVPSRFDQNLPSVVLEGKSDYYILEYMRRQHGPESLRLIPGMGSGTFSALISLSVGWGTKFLFLLDSDEAGEKERKRYALELGAPASALLTINEVISGAKEIESLLDDIAWKKIQSELGLPRKPNKKQVRRFFQEKLAQGEYVSLGSGFTKKSKALLAALDRALAAVTA